MRTLCPNLDREDGLETVLEVPIPEEMFVDSYKHKSWQNMKSWIKSHSINTDHKSIHASVFGGRNAEIQLLLGVVAAPLIPHPIRCDHSVNKKINDHPIVSSFTMLKFLSSYFFCAALTTTPNLCVQFVLRESKVLFYFFYMQIVSFQKRQFGT